MALLNMNVASGAAAMSAFLAIGGCAGASREQPDASRMTGAAVVVRVPEPAPPPTTRSPLVVAAGPFRFTIRDASKWEILDDPALDRKLEGWLNAHDGAHRSGRLVATIRWRGVSKRLLRAAVRTHMTTVTVPVTIVRARLRVRPIRQAFRNNCETAALSMALDGRVSQRRLQASLPRARPLRRQRTPRGDVWGDPQRGFVGGDNRGGYGVYDRPLLRLAQRHAPASADLTGRTLTALVRSVAAGRPVVAWVTLGPSRPISWFTPAGRRVNADAAEHAVTVIGFTRSAIEYNDPVDGLRKAVSRTEFESRWRALGRRAITSPSMAAPTSL